MNWNWWTWSHDKTTATNQCEQFCWSDEQVDWLATKWNALHSDITRISHEQKINAHVWFQVRK